MEDDNKTALGKITFVTRFLPSENKVYTYITGPELAEIHLEFDEQTTNQRDGAYDTGHQNRQDQQSGDQATSIKEDKALVTIMEDM